MNQNLTNSNKTLQVLLILASFTVIVAGMKAAESIIVPFLLAVFISIVASPPFFYLQKKGIPKVIALLIVILAFLFFIFLIGLLIGTSVNDFTSKVPVYQQKLQGQTQAVVTWLIEKKFIEPDFQLSNVFNPSSVLKIIGDTLNQVSGLFANGFLILLTVLFMMLEITSIPVKLKKVSSNPENSILRVQSVFQNINKYIAIKTWISLGTGILVYILLLIIGVDYPLLWAVLAFALNYIPTIGSIIALVPPVLLTIIQLGFIESLIVLVGYLVINTIMGNILEPKFMGKGLGLSTLVVFLSLIFWGWVLGPIGMLLSVPLTIAIKIAVDSSDETKWLAVLLGPENTE
ncbi:MAG: AI-2E family transporter [Ignavibacteriaceae bacterium]|nr:AI-2E family transporter [Ignavibacteriaceae bacterium]MCW8816772.1 AI-2E family transporter [Ignavibacteriaceae bacterium]MCW8961477.1 AI-2E family transporter [Ignavibacteriaceae bacterium]